MAESPRPSVFVGSSTEGLDIARAVQVQLDHDCQVEVWTDGLFTPGKTVFGALSHAISRFDFAVLVVTPDDVTLTREQERNTTRDNVVFELGLFLGALGQDRVFMLRDRTKPIDLPSDLVGVISADYQPHDTGNAEAAVGAACTRIRQQIQQLGVRPSTAYQQMSDAAAGVDRVGEYLESRGIGRYLVEIGGETRTRGRNHLNQFWRIGISTPDHSGQLQKILRLNNMSVATSGDYHNYFDLR